MSLNGCVKFWPALLAIFLSENRERKPLVITTKIRISSRSLIPSVRIKTQRQQVSLVRFTILKIIMFLLLPLTTQMFLETQKVTRTQRMNVTPYSPKSLFATLRKILLT